MLIYVIFWFIKSINASNLLTGAADDVIFPEVDVIFVIFPEVDVIFVIFPEDGKFNMTFVVRLARGAKILEEFIVPSTSLPSTNPDGSVEFSNDTSTCQFSDVSPLYRDTLVTLSRDVTFI